MASGGGGKDSGREESVWRFGKVEEGLGKVLTQGIELEWPEEGDRGEGSDVEASGRASLGSGRNEKEERTDQRVPHPSR